MPYNFRTAHLEIPHLQVTDAELGSFTKMMPDLGKAIRSETNLSPFIVRTNDVREREPLTNTDLRDFYLREIDSRVATICQIVQGLDPYERECLLCFLRFSRPSLNWKELGFKSLDDCKSKCKSLSEKVGYSVYDKLLDLYISTIKIPYEPEKWSIRDEISPNLLLGFGEPKYLVGYQGFTLQEYQRSVDFIVSNIGRNEYDVLVEWSNRRRKQSEVASQNKKGEFPEGYNTNLDPEQIQIRSFMFAKTSLRMASHDIFLMVFSLLSK